MNQKDFISWIRGIIIFMVIVFLIVGGFMVLNYVGGKYRERDCAILGDQIGYNTRVISAYCRIEIRPNLWVDKDEIAEFLPLIDCERNNHEKNQ